MNREKIKKIISIALAGLVILGAISTTAKFVNERLVKSHTVTNETLNHKEITMEKTIVEGLKEEAKFNILTLYTGTKTTIDQTPVNFFNLFDRIKEVEFKGESKYYIDFSAITDANVRVNENDIILYLAKPTVESHLDLKNTQFRDLKGLMQFGEVELSMEETTQLQTLAEEEIHKVALEEENMREATQRAEDKVKNLIESITKESHNVKIVWS